ncbi:MAG TPA: hypothetical protein VMH28_09355 [Candidatus Acidoferrales bacterium]|nr:hypothetical protein [Candidatus Acidoferrales bacterium]
MARRKTTPAEPAAPPPRQAPPETGPDSAGQSGDLQGLSGSEESENESVRELVEEGQFFEASVVEGVENVPPADSGPLRPRRRREDDLPPEYSDVPGDEPKE